MMRTILMMKKKRMMMRRITQKRMRLLDHLLPNNSSQNQSSITCSKHKVPLTSENNNPQILLNNYLTSTNQLFLNNECILV